MNTEKMGPPESFSLPLTAEVRERLIKPQDFDPTKALAQADDHDVPVVWISPFEDGTWCVNTLPMDSRVLDDWLSDWEEDDPVVLRFGTMTLLEIDSLGEFQGY